MADFVAVLRKTLDGLPNATPELRQKVYAKARATVAAKLAAMNPPPPLAAAERQKKALEDAILSVEADYKKREEPLLDPIEELESAIASLSTVHPAPQAPAPAPPLNPHSPPEPIIRDPVLELDAAARDDLVDEEEEQPIDHARRRSSAAILVIIGAIVLLAGAGYAAWLNRNDLAGLFGDMAPGMTATETEEPVEARALENGTDAPEEEVAAAEPQADEEPAPAEDAAVGGADPVQKFTQRLQADGTEVDMGPAGDEPAIGEGTSVAAATPPPLEAPQPSGTAGTNGPPSTETQPLVVGQRAIFYEERTNVADGSAEDGSIAWSIVRESPGGDLPPEPAIRAEATIPGKDLQLRMTIRRNGDPSLPASHIVEMIFLTPDNFEGGGIANVLRMALKDSEQSPGNPLIGIPAKIADGFFLIALSDGTAEVEANMTLLRRQSWIDIPIVYRSGRRALITMEKGIPGDKVFDEALRAWQEASSG